MTSRLDRAIGEAVACAARNPHSKPVRVWQDERDGQIYMRTDRYDPGAPTSTAKLLFTAE